MNISISTIMKIKQYEYSIGANINIYQYEHFLLVLLLRSINVDGSMGTNIINMNQYE